MYIHKHNEVTGHDERTHRDNEQSVCVCVCMCVRVCVCVRVCILCISCMYSTDVHCTIVSKVNGNSKDSSLCGPSSKCAIH